MAQWIKKVVELFTFVPKVKNKETYKKAAANVRKQMETLKQEDDFCELSNVFIMRDYNLEKNKEEVENKIQRLLDNIQNYKKKDEIFETEIKKICDENRELVNIIKKRENETEHLKKACEDGRNHSSYEQAMMFLSGCKKKALLLQNNWKKSDAVIINKEKNNTDLIQSEIYEMEKQEQKFQAQKKSLIDTITIYENENKNIIDDLTKVIAKMQKKLVLYKEFQEYSKRKDTQYAVLKNQIGMVLDNEEIKQDFQKLEREYQNLCDENEVCQNLFSEKIMTMTDLRNKAKFRKEYYNTLSQKLLNKKYYLEKMQEWKDSKNTFLNNKERYQNLMYKWYTDLENILDMTENYMEECQNKAKEEAKEFYDTYQIICKETAGYMGNQKSMEITPIFNKFMEIYTHPYAKETLTTFDFAKENFIFKNITDLSNYYNNIFLEKKLREEKNFFDNIWGKLLPNEQRRIILKEEDELLLYMNSEAEKLRLLDAKIRYLVQRKGVSTEDILILTSKSTNVNFLKEYLKKESGESYPIFDFWEFAKQILLQNQIGIEKKSIVKNGQTLAEPIKKYIREDCHYEEPFDELLKDLEKCLNYYKEHGYTKEDFVKIQKKILQGYKDNTKGEQFLQLFEYIYTTYQNDLIQNNKMDYYDLLFTTAKVLRNPNALFQWQYLIMDVDGMLSLAEKNLYQTIKCKRFILLQA